VGLVSTSGDGEGELAVAVVEVEAEAEAEEYSTADEDEEGVDAAGSGFVGTADKVDVGVADGVEDGLLDEAEALRALYATEISTKKLRGDEDKDETKPKGVKR
jgi:hypothetical protein